MLLEPVVGTVSLRGLMKTRSLCVTLLSPEGRALGNKASGANGSPTGSSFALGETKATC